MDNYLDMIRQGKNKSLGEMSDWELIREYTDMESPIMVGGPGAEAILERRRMRAAEARQELGKRRRSW